VCRCAGCPIAGTVACLRWVRSSSFSRYSTIVGLHKSISSGAFCPSFWQALLPSMSFPDSE
jgi:hypothetical protein